MRIEFAPRGILQITDARIVYRNFSGASSKFNREGDRNFSLVVDDEEIHNALVENGWNVKVKPPRDEDEMPFITMPVKVKFNDRGPVAYLESDGNMVKLDEESIGMLDDIDIESIDMDIRPYDWEMNGKTGRSAYLQGIWVKQKVDRFAARYARMTDEDKLDF